MQCAPQLTLGLLPSSFHVSPPLYGPSGSGGARASGPRPLISRSPKPAQRDRLRLDRYDRQDFEELEQAMKADGLWFL